MKMWIRSLFVPLALLAGPVHAVAQGTAFTYQGRLDDGGMTGPTTSIACEPINSTLPKTTKEELHDKPLGQ